MLLRVLPEPPVPHYTLPRPRIQSEQKVSLKQVSLGERLMDVPAYARKETNTCYPMSLEVLKGIKPIQTHQTNF